MAFVNTEGTVGKHHDDSIQVDRVLHNLDVLRRWRRVESALVLLTDCLDEATVVSAKREG